MKQEPQIHTDKYRLGFMDKLPGGVKTVSSFCAQSQNPVDVETHTINYQLKRIFSDNELDEDSVIRKFRITAKDGKNYNTRHYNLSAIIAVGYKVNSERAVQFRKWATGIIQEHTIKAYVMDDERLKNDGSILGKKYFEEQLERIREIRFSERKFYQKITDIYATALDYAPSATATKRFFAAKAAPPVYAE